MSIDTTDKNNIYDCIVVGGGISGISFAHYMHKAGKSVLIVEKANKYGGQIQSNYLKTNSHYWNELGAHTCYNSYMNLLSIVKETEGKDLIQLLDKFKYVLYSSGKIKSIFSEISILRCGLGMFKLFFFDKKGKTVREYFRPIVGASNYDRLFTNAFKAVISQNADNYPAEMFLKRRKGKDKELSRRFTFKNGLSSCLDSIVEKDNLEINTLSEVTEIQKTDINNENIFVLKTKTGNSYYARNIALASGPQVTSVLLKDIEPELSALFASIPMFKSESLSITVEKDRLEIEKVAGIIPISDEFLSAVSRDLVVEDSQMRSFTFHFEKGKKNMDEKIDMICRIMNISQSDIIESRYMEHALPSLRVEHLFMDKKVEERRTDKNIYILGNYFYGLSLEDCVNRSKAEFDRSQQNTFL